MIVVSPVHCMIASASAVRSGKFPHRSGMDEGLRNTLRLLE